MFGFADSDKELNISAVSGQVVVGDENIIRDVTMDDVVLRQQTLLIIVLP